MICNSVSRYDRGLRLKECIPFLLGRIRIEETNLTFHEFVDGCETLLSVDTNPSVNNFLLAILLYNAVLDIEDNRGDEVTHCYNS